MAADDPNEAESGKFETPCDLMHVANTTRLPPGGSPVVLPTGAVVVDVVVPRLAKPEFREPPPQAAAATARPMRAATTNSRRSWPKPTRWATDMKDDVLRFLTRSPGAPSPRARDPRTTSRRPPQSPASQEA